MQLISSKTHFSGLYALLRLHTYICVCGRMCGCETGDLLVMSELKTRKPEMGKNDFS